MTLSMAGRGVFRIVFSGLFSGSFIPATLEGRFPTVSQNRRFRMRTPSRHRFFGNAVGLIALAFSLSACIPTSGLGEQTTLTGKISNWPAGKTGTVSTVLGSSATVGTDGSFSIALPGSPQIDPKLTTFNSSLNGLCASGTVTLTPGLVKAFSVTLDINRVGLVSAGTLVFWKHQDANIALPTNGDKTVLYVYADQNVTMTGSCVSSGLEIALNVSLVKGWNAVTVTINDITANPKAASISTGPVSSDVVWFFLGDTSKL
jgi:hypothetical protein